MALWIPPHPPVRSWHHFRDFMSFLFSSQLFVTSSHTVHGLIYDPIQLHQHPVICCCSDPSPNIMMPQDTHCLAAASRQAGHDAELMTVVWRAVAPGTFYFLTPRALCNTVDSHLPVVVCLQTSATLELSYFTLEASYMFSLDKPEHFTDYSLKNIHYTV